MRSPQSNLTLAFIVFALTALSAAPAAAQINNQSCAAGTQQLYLQVSATRQSFIAPGDGYMTNYYTGWNGNCWDPSQDAFAMANLGNGPFNFIINIFDPQNLGMKFTDQQGNGCLGPNAPNPNFVVVFGKINSKGRVIEPLAPWPIPNLPPSEAGEYYNFQISPDQKSISFNDRDNRGPDYHFGVYLCDHNANNPSGVYLFLSDPGQQPKGTTQPIEPKP